MWSGVTLRSFLQEKTIDAFSFFSPCLVQLVYHPPNVTQDRANEEKIDALVKFIGQWSGNLNTNDRLEIQNKYYRGKRKDFFMHCSESW